MRTGETVGLEALIRWQHPTRGILPPSEFLPAIEGKPLSIKLGELVLKTAMRQIAQWKSQGLALVVSINIDAIHLLHSSFIPYIQSLLTQYPTVQTTDFVLEILETTAIDNITNVVAVMEACKTLNISFSLDDFGTGYSSLTYLKRLPVSELKIDKSFVRNMLHDPDDLAILDGVVSLAKAFRRHLVAEGVEEIKQGEFLIHIGCDIAQGYVVSRPMSSGQVFEWVKNYRPDTRWTQLEPISRDALPLLYAAVELG
jgi:EAL domain-containing protein (putative c-di-GMP-specific phosphodiesterase class I)